jgi:hypothetical protein
MSSSFNYFPASNNPKYKHKSFSSFSSTQPSHLHTYTYIVGSLLRAALQPAQMPTKSDNAQPARLLVSHSMGTESLKGM